MDSESASYISSKLSLALKINGEYEVFEEISDDLPMHSYSKYFTITRNEFKLTITPKYNFVVSTYRTFSEEWEKGSNRYNVGNFVVIMVADIVPVDKINYKI